MEEFVDIPGYEGFYQVSNMGNVRSLSKRKKGKMLSLADNGEGYFAVCLCKHGTQKTSKVHRLVAEAFVENPDNKPEVNHIDGNKKDNRFFKLEWVTDSEQIVHAYQTGLKVSLKGEAQSAAKLTERKVRDIKLKYAQGATSYRLLANEYGVDRALIYGIIKGTRWAHVNI